MLHQNEEFLREAIRLSHEKMPTRTADSQPEPAVGSISDWVAVVSFSPGSRT